MVLKFPGEKILQKMDFLEFKKIFKRSIAGIFGFE